MRAGPEAVAASASSQERRWQRSVDGGVGSEETTKQSAVGSAAVAVEEVRGGATSERVRRECGGGWRRMSERVRRDRRIRSRRFAFAAELIAVTIGAVDIVVLTVAVLAASAAERPLPSQQISRRTHRNHCCLKSVAERSRTQLRRRRLAIAAVLVAADFAEVELAVFTGTNSSPPQQSALAVEAESYLPSPSQQGAGKSVRRSTTAEGGKFVIC
nr:hypothetical protein Iba_chr02dCG8220 [Ipomoea batatas]